MREAAGFRKTLQGLAALGSLALLLAPTALAHGNLITPSKDVGPYHVIFYTSDYVTEGELQRLGWNVSDRGTGARVALEHPQAVLRFFDAKGAAVLNKTVDLEQPVEGIVLYDVTMGPPGRANYTLLLPNGSQASFEQPVIALGAPPPTPARATTPWFDAAFPAALGIAALGFRASRRGPAP